MVFKKGVKHNEEHRRKISEALKGKKQPWTTKRNLENNPMKNEETRKKVSQSLKGRMPWQKILGGNHPKVIKYKEKVRRLSSINNKGNTAWNKGLTKKDNPDRIKYGLFGDKNPVRRTEVRLKISKANKGKLMGDLNPAKREENREKIKLGLKKAFEEGRRPSFKMEKNPMWKGGLSFEPYTTDWTNALRKIIRKRDSYTCQLCGKIQEGKLLSVHHMDYDKKNCFPENLITLCRKCHSKTNVNRDKWIKKFRVSS